MKTFNTNELLVRHKIDTELYAGTKEYDLINCVCVCVCVCLRMCIEDTVGATTDPTNRSLFHQVTFGYKLKPPHNHVIAPDSPFMEREDPTGWVC